MDARQLFILHRIVLVLLCVVFCGGLNFDEDYDDAPSFGRCPWIKNKLRNGRVKLRSRGRIAKFFCDPGFELAGKRFATCVRGQWNNPIPFCVARGCPRLRHIASGQVVEENRGAMLTYVCHPGYALDGPSSIYCDGKRWNADPPTCIVTNPDPEVMCDFEDPGLCGWSHDPQSDFDWKRNHFSTPSGHVGTGPSFDHTFGPGKAGFYLYLEASSPRKAGDKTRLFSPVFPPEYSDGCFVMWYHMYGSSTGSLRVYLKPESHVFGEFAPDWERTGEQGNEWIRADIPIPNLHENFQIVIEGVRGYSYVGDTAIDDVQLTRESCESVQNETDAVSSTVAESCRGRCDEKETSEASCGCTEACLSQVNCCRDFFTICAKGNETVVENPEEPPAVLKPATTQHILPSAEETSPPAVTEAGMPKDHTETPQSGSSTRFPSASFEQDSYSSTTGKDEPTEMGGSSTTPRASSTAKTLEPEVSVTVGSTKSAATSAKTAVPEGGKTERTTASEVLQPVKSTVPVTTSPIRTTANETPTTIKTVPPLTVKTTTAAKTSSSPSTTLKNREMVPKSTVSSTYISSTASSTTTVLVTTSPARTTDRPLSTTMMGTPAAETTSVTPAPSRSATSTLALITTSATPPSPTNDNPPAPTTAIILITTLRITTSSTPTPSSTQPATVPTSSTPESTRKTYNLRPRNRTNTTTSEITTVPSTVRSSTLTSTSSSAMTSTSTVSSTPSTSVTSPETSTRVSTTAKPLTMARYSLIPTTSRDRIVTTNEPSTTGLVTTAARTWEPPFTKAYESSESKANSVTNEGSPPVVTIVSIVLVAAVIVIVGVAYYMRNKIAKRQSRLSDDSEMRFLSENEEIEYSDASVLDRILRQ